MAVNPFPQMMDTPSRRRFPQVAPLLRKLSMAALAVAALLVLDSCSSSKPGTGGLPKNLPHIALQGSSSTPPHNLPSYSYPFDSGGNYVSDWAAEGERRAGRSAAASSSDAAKWKASHGGAASKAKPRVVTSSRSSGSGAKKSTSSKGKTVAKKSTSSGGRSYSVKKGDTLSAIARRNGTSVAKLKAANGLKSDNIGIGKVLRVPRA